MYLGIQDTPAQEYQDIPATQVPEYQVTAVIPVLTAHPAVPEILDTRVILERGLPDTQVILVLGHQATAVILGLQLLVIQDTQEAVYLDIQVILAQG